MVKFIDEVQICVKSGDGGRGCVGFRREPRVPNGGPNGGDGGDGGKIIFQATSSENTLVDYRYQRHFFSQNGRPGQGSNKFGANGEDLILKVPVGTQVFAEDGVTILDDIVEEGKPVIFLEGGKGGLGNTRFKSSTNRSPRQFTLGSEGQEMWVTLKLKILSDVGIIGLPNAGKSTLLTKASRARPKIADYPFTTLYPKLGVVYTSYGEFVMCDIPGLIEGASQGTGLGHKFLKHVERCRLFLHLIDVNSDNIVENYITIKKELEMYNASLSEKEEIIVLNKAELMIDEELQAIKRELEDLTSKKIYVISCYNEKGLDSLFKDLYAKVEQVKLAEMAEKSDCNNEVELDEENNILDKDEIILDLNS